MKNTNPLQIIPKSGGRIVLGALILASSVSLFSQDTTNNDDDVFELSPFEVSTNENIGYLANNTLAGTRIASQLEDIANSVQVVTAEFLDDTGATNVSELLIYTTATEAPGELGNFSAGEINSQTERGERARREPQLATRVRGLAVADLARDYFISDVAFDPYNSSEITINRGPNASLFGLGSPGGIINQSIDKAQTDRSFGRVDFKIDEFEAWRVSLNYNLVVLEDKLAVRVAYLDSNKRYEQKNAKMDEERYFIAATWRPMKNMAFRANYEKGEALGVRPKLRAPTDRVTTWIANGKPAYNVLENKWYIGGDEVTDDAYIAELTASSMDYGSWTGPRNGATMIFDDPTSSVPGGNTYAVMQTGINNGVPGRDPDSQYPNDPTISSDNTYIMRTFHGPRSLLARNPDYIVGARPEIDSRAIRYYYDPQITDLSFVNIRENSLSGPGIDRHLQNFEVKSFRFEKTWLDNNLGIELAYQDQYWEADLTEAQTASSASNIQVDINLVLMDGSPNPNFGRPFIGGRGYAQYRIREREAAQAIAFAKYDFADKHDGLLKHFGRHSLTAVYQSQENEETQPNRMNARADTTWKSIIGQADSPSANSMQRMSINQYIGPSLANASSINEITIQPVTTVQEFQGTDNALKWNPNTGEFEKASVSIYTVQNDPEQVWTWGNPGNRDEIDSLSTVLQSHFLNDHIVTTVSWRQDDVKTFTGAAAADPADGLYNQGDPINYGDALFDETVEQTTYGIVGHVPDNWLPGNFGLSVHYVDSSNFAAGTAGNDILNNPAPLQAGNTEEYGFSLSAMDNKLYARVNFFETSQDWVKILGTLPQVGNTLAAVMNSNTPEQLAAAGWSLTDGSLFDPGTITALNLREEGGTWQADNIAGTATNYYQFTSSEGMEVEISYAPTPNWRIHMNIAEVESEVSNVMPIAGPELSRIANEVFLDPVLGDLFIVENPTQFPDGSYAENDQLWSAADNLLGAIAAKKEPEGGPLQEIRRWRVNFITNYSFSGSRWDDSFLSNFTVGGALRWQDKAAIGAGLREVDGVIVPDYEKPIYGPSETNIDAWINYNTTVMDDIGLRLQLRVRNLNKGSGDFIPLKANPDGEVALWRIGAPMYVELSARLTF